MADPESTTPNGQEPTENEGQEPVVESETEVPETRPKPDEANVKQLRREAQQLRNRTKEAESKLQELLDRDKSEQERLADAKATAEAKAEKAELRLMRYEVAAAHGLELRAAEFLSGESREELEERADELTKLLAEQAKPASTSFDGGARQTPPETKEPGEAHNEFLLKQLGRRSGA
jgi:hypothetical protein